MFFRRHSLLFPLFFLHVMIIAGGNACVCRAEEDATGEKAVKWLTDAARQRALQNPVSMVTWDHAPVEQTLAKFTRNAKLALAVDCRVNPELEVNRTCQNASIPVVIQDMLTSLEDPARLMPSPAEAYAVSQVGNVLYVGPAEYTRKLQTLLTLQEEKIPAKAKKAWEKKTPLSWAELAEPRDILQKIAKNYSVKITNLKTVPHDLWPETRLPELTLTEQLTLILGQFGLTYDFSSEDASGKTVEIRPLKLSEIAIRRVYAKSREPLLTEVKKKFPETEVAEESGKLSVLGAVEVHRFLQAGDPKTVALNVGGFPKDLASEKAQAALENVTFTAKFQGAFLALMEQFCEKNQLTLVADRDALTAAGVNPDIQIRMEVEKLRLEELLRELAKIAKCDVEIDGNRIRVFPQ